MLHFPASHPSTQHNSPDPRSTEPYPVLVPLSPQIPHSLPSFFYPFPAFSIPTSPPSCSQRLLSRQSPPTSDASTTRYHSQITTYLNPWLPPFLSIHLPRSNLLSVQYTASTPLTSHLPLDFSPSIPSVISTLFYLQVPPSMLRKYFNSSARAMCCHPYFSARHPSSPCAAFPSYV